MSRAKRRRPWLGGPMDGPTELERSTMRVMNHWDDIEAHIRQHTRGLSDGEVRELAAAIIARQAGLTS
jgi:hypothetical protein